jgi:hypothetical protein
MEQKAELDRVVPQNEAIFRSREWAEWKAGLSPAARAFAESGDAREVIQAIYAFAADMKARMGQTATSDGQQQQVPPERRDAVTEERERKANASPEVKSHAAKANKEPDMDQLFSEAYKTIGKENHIL